MTVCPACRAEVAGLVQLADHFWEAAEASDVRHVMWLNRHVGLRELPREALRERLGRALGDDRAAGHEDA